MGLFGDSSGSKTYGKLPKVGEKPIEITIKSVERKEFPDWKDKGFQFCPNFQKKDGTDCGHHYHLITDDDTVYTIKAWSLYFALQESKADVGSTIQIDHPKNGEWNVKVLKESSSSEPEDVAWEE